MASFIDPDFEVIPSLANQVAPLSAGQLDVVSGAISAGVYNAVDRIPIKIIADIRNAQHYGYNVIMVWQGPLCQRQGQIAVQSQGRHGRDDWRRLV